ncbi:hypothetical protein [Corynebacterium sp. p3-SID1056]|uniref:hypothetical protein n=1 Tax=Corynebacterium sp. p3-SID1056 TaxID=2916092 RepID=UPI0021A3EC90|nr:hypothetical protein [Corynebacterium sp. p3-SID1056]MCT2338772.1 hypothetical protein [Corynebacterium sp. p3-SID1056]
MADVLRVSAENTSRADGSVAGLLGSIGVVERSGGAGAVAGLMGQTLSQYENANSFANPRPAAGAQGSLPVLHQQLMATQVAQATAAAAFWGQNAALVQSVVAQLPAVAGMLADSAETAFVAGAINKLGEVSRVGQEYVARSVLMQGHATGLAQVAGAEQLMAHGAMAVWAGLPGPSRALFEQSYLGVFPPRLTASLQAAVPVFDRLLPDLGSIPGDGVAVADMPSPQVPGFGESPLPRTLRDAFTAAGLGVLGQAVTPSQVVGEYGLPTPEVLEQVAAKTPAGAAGTEAASVGLGQLAPTGAGVGAGLAPTTGAGGGVGTLGQPGAAGLGMPGGPGGAGVGGVAPTVAAGAGGAGAGGSAGGVAGPVGAGAGAGAGGGRGAGAQGARGRGRVPRDAHAGAAVGGALGAGAGIAGAGAGIGAGRGVAGFGAGVPGGAGQVPGAAAAAGSATGAGGGRAGGVMAAGPMGAGGGRGGQGKSRAKVKAVTSAVERDGNLEALLGQSPLVLPTVIGHNVRE